MFARAVSFKPPYVCLQKVIVSGRLLDRPLLLLYVTAWTIINTMKCSGCGEWCAYDKVGLKNFTVKTDV